MLGVQKVSCVRGAADCVGVGAEPGGTPQNDTPEQDQLRLSGIASGPRIIEELCEFIDLELSVLVLGARRSISVYQRE